jgi:hypothetical protein
LLGEADIVCPPFPSCPFYIPFIKYLR